MKRENILVGETIYIVGHKKPDVDAIVSAYAYQVYRHARGDFNYIAIRCDKVNNVTKWLFKETGYALPKLVKDISDKKIVLVDHTDPKQRADGWENSEIIEVLDHHKLKLETSVPPKITIRPYGSTTTLIASKLIRANVNFKPEFAQLMLSAILDDTLALRSPITTYLDKTIAGELSAISGVADLDAYAKKLFNKKDTWNRMKAAKIVNTDTKRYEMGGNKIGISQVETMDNRKIRKSKTREITKYIKKVVKEEDLDLFVVMLTDMLRQDAVLITAGEKAEDVETIFDNPKKAKDGSFVLDGIMSRKRQMVPKLAKLYKKSKSKASAK
jgi:manganese-dependent inorganic pyrophosphatase